MDASYLRLRLSTSSAKGTKKVPTHTQNNLTFQTWPKHPLRSPGSQWPCLHACCVQRGQTCSGCPPWPNPGSTSLPPASRTGNEEDPISPIPNCGLGCKKELKLPCRQQAGQRSYDWAPNTANWHVLRRRQGEREAARQLLSISSPATCRGHEK